MKCGNALYEHPDFFPEGVNIVEPEFTADMK